MNFMEISKLPNKGNGIGRISNKMSIITIFDHKHLKNWTVNNKIACFPEKSENCVDITS